MHRKLTRYAAILATALVVYLVVPPAPAAAADLAVGHCESSYNATAYSTYSSTRACDENDQTQFVVDNSGGGFTCAVKLDLTADETVHTVRVVVGTGGTGETVPQVFANTSASGVFDSTCTGTTMTRVIDEPDWDSTTTSTCDGNECKVYTKTFTSDVSARFWSVRYNGGTNGAQFFTVELLEGTPTREFEEYVYGLQVTHPQFARQIGWFWRITWEGVWSVTDSDDDVLAGGLSGGAANTGAGVRIQCPVVCGPDTYTIHIHEDGYSEVSYVIDGDDEGYLIPDARAAELTFVEGCYNAALDDCGAPLNGAADSLGSRFTISPRAGNGAHDNTGTVSIGRWDATANGCTFVGSPLTTAVLDVGTYTQLITAWAETAGHFDDQGRQLVLYRWDSATDPAYYACKVLAVDVQGGVTTTRTSPVDSVTPCTITDLACNIGRQIENAMEAVLGAAEDVWTGATTELHDAASAKLPFAYVVLVVDGVNAQIDRAALAVENSDDCAGLVLEVPLMYGSSPTNASPTPWPITVLDCASLEATPLGSTWYQTVRGALDPALWLLFAWAQLKQLQPKASLNG